MLIDTSVLVQWFHVEGEREVVAARALRDAHLAGAVRCRVLDLGFYEFGNVVLRALRRPADEVGRAVAALATIVGAAVPFDVEWSDLTAALGKSHDLTFYDASWAAAARHLGVALVSADRQLLNAGLAESAAAAATRLGLLT